MQAQFLRSFHAVCVLLGALLLGGCDFIVVDEKGNQRTFDFFNDTIRPGERVLIPTLFGFVDSRSLGTPLPRQPLNQIFIPTQRWAYGISVGGTWGSGEMDHFLPAANTDSHIRDFTATGTFEYSRAFNYDPRNATVIWGRAGFDITTPTSGNSSPNFGGEILHSHVSWQFIPKIGASIQFMEQNGKTSGLFPINHCVWMMGGPVFTNINDNFAGVSHSKIITGWTIGAGLDFNYPNDWTARIGVHYTDLGRNTIPLAGGDVRVEHTDWSVKVGLSRRFEIYGPSLQMATTR